jgi:hypothetical protein
MISYMIVPHVDRWNTSKCLCYNGIVFKTISMLMPNINQNAFDLPKIDAIIIKIKRLEAIPHFL